VDAVDSTKRRFSCWASRHALRRSACALATCRFTVWLEHLKKVHTSLHGALVWTIMNTAATMLLQWCFSVPELRSWRSRRGCLSLGSKKRRPRFAVNQRFRRGRSQLPRGSPPAVGVAEVGCVLVPG
jgi:hypothetical protein